MSEFLPLQNPELERKIALQRLIEQYFPEDIDFLEEMDEEEKLSYIYGQLLELGEDPDEVLHEFGVTEEPDEH